MTRAAIYARFSHAEGDSDSVEVQVHRARQGIESMGWTLSEAHIFDDDGVSGRELIKRKGYRRLLDVATRHEFDVCVVRDMDRFSRADPIRVLHALQQLDDLDVRVWQYLKKDFVRIDDEHALLTMFSAYGNRKEATKAGERIKDKLLLLDERNEGWTSIAPYGFRNLRRKPTGEIGEFMDRKGTIGVIVRHDAEYPALLLMAELFLKLGTFNATATALNQRHIASPTGGTWQAHSVREILKNQTYRGEVVRGRVEMLDKGGTLAKVKARPEAIRRYSRPELKVWDDETIAKLDELIRARAGMTTWSTSNRTRKHLSSSFVKCGVCGASVSITSSARSKNSSYCCTKARSKACEGVGYRAEHIVDSALIRACRSQVEEDVLEETLAIVRETLDIRRRVDARALEHDRLKRDIASSERRMRSFTDAIGEARDGTERAPLLQALRTETTRLNDLKAALARFEADPAPVDAETILRDLEARILGLRATLGLGGIEALPAVASIMGGERLTATRTPDGWVLEGRVSRAFLFDKAGTNQKLAVHGNVTGVSVTPVTAVAETAPQQPAPSASSAVPSGTVSK